MSDRPTPETDEQVNGKPCTRFAIAAGDSLRDALVPSEFARRLERERDEANYFLNELAEVDGQLKFRINELCEVLRKTEKERDEARERYNELLGVKKEPKWYNGREIPIASEEAAK
jgi:hypothetical protein